MKKVLGLAVAMAMASQANAAIDLPQIDVNNTGGSELVLVVWDQAAKTTYTRDLGIDYRAFNEGNAYSFAADSRMSSLFGSTLNSSLVWGVWAGDAVATGSLDSGQANTWGASIMTTSVKAATNLSKPMTSLNIDSANNVLSNFVNASNTLVNGTHLSQADGSSTAVEGQNANSANVGYQIKTNWSGQFPASSLQALGQDAYFLMAQAVYVETLVYDENGDGIYDPAVDIMDYLGDNTWNAAITQFKGTWKLGTDGTLTWASAAGPAPVPVPAAVWLFISGLAGLAGIARRQNA